MRKFCLVMVLFAGTSMLYAQQLVTRANYAMAAKYSPNRLKKMVFSTSVDPHWLKKSNRFWYMYETTAGKKWLLVDPVKNEKKILFDNDKLAAAITLIVKDPFDAQHLPIDSLKFVRDENWIQFQIKSSIDEANTDTSKNKSDEAKPKKKVFYFEYNINTNELVELRDFKRPVRKPAWANISPDSAIVLFGRDNNLYWMDKQNYEKSLRNEDDSTIVEHVLTKDGIENFSYYNSSNLSGLGESNVDKEKNKKKRKAVWAYWSPNSRYFTLTRVDNKNVQDLWIINSIAQPRPTLETYKYWMPGEKQSPVDHLYVFDMQKKEGKELQLSAFKDQDISIWATPGKKNNRDDDTRPGIWLGNNLGFYFTRTSRDLKRIDICKAWVVPDTIQTLIEERFNTYVEVKRLGLVNDGKELVEWSERDGWGHFYLYDANGKLKNQITSGPYHCEDILGIDSDKRILYFTANAREKNENPYYLHAYSIHLDGTGLTLLNQGNFDHSVDLNDDNRYFVDNSGRVNTVPVSVLYNSDGKVIMNLEIADLSALMATGYRFPEPFTVKANDGITDLYGVLYKPFDFDSTKKYPVIEYVYPGPQTEAVNTAFSTNMNRTDRLAQLGFVVVTVGNRGGNPSRSKWYHTYGYGNLRDYGLADKKTAAEQLCNKYAFMDINRVGIHGHSGGGFMSAAAMLVYPNFFKVAVASSGNHDNSIYNRWWSEKHHGVKEIIIGGDTSFVYSIDKNPTIASHLKGHLMLSTGDIDNNVHPANTIRLANELIKANKRFDLVILPGQRHGYGDMTEYFWWRMADYFSKYLMGDDTERSVNITEIENDMPMNK